MARTVGLTFPKAPKPKEQKKENAKSEPKTEK